MVEYSPYTTVYGLGLEEPAHFHSTRDNTLSGTSHTIYYPLFRGTSLSVLVLERVLTVLRNVLKWAGLRARDR